MTSAIERFRALHESGCFVIPNPWDRGSAALLARLGFPALATTSAGYAFSRGLPDTPSALSRDEVLAHVAEIVSATELPVSADYQHGYAPDADGVLESVRACVARGVAGVSIEDATGDPASPLFALPDAVARVPAAASAVADTGVVLTARAECFLTGHPDPLRESLRRLSAYAQAGADVLYAPGARDEASIQAIVAAVAPKPVNVLIGWDSPLRVEHLARLGVRRISVGSALARAALTAFWRAAQSLSTGDFSAFASLLSTRELSEMFAPRGPR